MSNTNTPSARNEDGKIEDVSDTALWVAMYRARESERPDALFNDSLAAKLAGTRGEKIVNDMPFAKMMGWALVVRTTAIDRMILDLIKNAGEVLVDTIVNLGAGLDTRPYRMKLPNDLRWVEADFPHMIALKNEKLKNEKPVCLLERAAVDLSSVDERRSFLKRINSESKKVIVITEGVIPYLSADDAAALADDLHAVSNFRYWIQDFYLGSMAGGKTGSRFGVGWAKKLASAPLKFSTPDWFAFFNEHGWPSREIVYFQQEGHRIGRPVPQPYRFLAGLFPWRSRQFEKFAGCAVFERR